MKKKIYFLISIFKNAVKIAPLLILFFLFIFVGTVRALDFDYSVGSCDVNADTYDSSSFCGWSDYGFCNKDNDCLRSGCSNQVCGVKSYITTCEWSDYYNPIPYGLYCGCRKNSCQWKSESEPCVSCVIEGRSMSVISNPPECCQGLRLIPPKEPDILGIKGICTAECGNGICNSETESDHNCPEDCPIPGDVNRDCKVNILDMILIRNRLGQDVRIGDNWKADVNQDNGINFLDLFFARNHLNTKCE